VIPGVGPPDARIVKNITFNAVEGVDPGKTGAWFREYGDGAMRIRLEYHIRALDRWKEVKDAVNQDLQQVFEDAEFDLAVPAAAVPTGDKPL
jgi:MscS family membrane protein